MNLIPCPKYTIFRLRNFSSLFRSTQIPISDSFK